MDRAQGWTSPCVLCSSEKYWSGERVQRAPDPRPQNWALNFYWPANVTSVYLYVGGATPTLCDSHIFQRYAPGQVQRLTCQDGTIKFMQNMIKWASVKRFHTSGMHRAKPIRAVYSRTRKRIEIAAGVPSGYYTRWPSVYFIDVECQFQLK